MSVSCLEFDDVSVDFKVHGFRKPPFRAVDSVSLNIDSNETVGLVGESGSGKSTLGRAALGLVPLASGSIRFEGEEIRHATYRQRRELARKIQVVFQDPFSSLNPSMTIGAILGEPLSANGIRAVSIHSRTVDMLARVGLPADVVDRYPREFSGGQRQRIAIARALVLEPKLVICDEPVSALDLSTQATVLDLFIDIQRQLGVSYLFISHDLSVIRHISHRVAVMRNGRILESGAGERVTSQPEHPYTQRLFLSSPLPDPVAQKQRREERHQWAAHHQELSRQLGP